MPIRHLAAALLLATASPAMAQTIASTTPPALRSATVARDIGGFALGMHIRDVNKVTPVTELGNDNFEATHDGIAYDFGVTPKGRIYRVSSTQKLGRFQIDPVFLRSVAAKLSAKYGSPQSSSAETFGWSLTEQVTRSDGQILPFTTNWASAYVSSSISDGVTLDLKLLDFRILWADEAELNKAPRDKAVEALSF